MKKKHPIVKFIDEYQGSRTSEEYQRTLSLLEQIRPDMERGEKFIPRGRGGEGPIKKRVRAVLDDAKKSGKPYPFMSTKDVWERVKKRLPKDWSVIETKRMKWLEGPQPRDPKKKIHTVSYKTFGVICSDVREELDPKRGGKKIESNFRD